MFLLSLLFIALTALSSFAFYRKYQVRLQRKPSPEDYLRVADYLGRPISLDIVYHADAKSEAPVEVDVDEIYHYGKDYFLRGVDKRTQKREIYSWSRIVKMHRHSDGRILHSLDALFMETRGRWQSLPV